MQPGLRGLTREFGLNQCRCNQLLNVGEYQFLQVELPSVSPEELKDAARWHVKDMVSYEVESMTMDVLEVPVLAGRTGRGHQGFVVAADDGLIAEQMAAFNSADAMLEAIDIPEMALRNVAALFEEPERGLAMLAFDEERITLIFTFHGELYAVRQIEIPRSKLEQSEGEWRRQMFDRIGLETQRSLDNFERLHSHISVSRLLLSPLPTVPGLMDYMREYLPCRWQKLIWPKCWIFRWFPSWLSRGGRLPVSSCWARHCAIDGHDFEELIPEHESPVGDIYFHPQLLVLWARGGF